MKKALALSLALVGLLSIATMAGPTIGIGLGWFGGDTWIAPTVGTRLVEGSVGCALNVAIGELNFVSGEDWESVAGTFTSFTLTADVLRQAPVTVYLEGGIGTPALVGMNADGFVFTGWEVGAIVGAGVTWDTGWGVEVLAYINEDNVGIGIQGTYDFFLGARYVKP